MMQQEALRMGWVWVGVGEGNPDVYTEQNILSGKWIWPFEFVPLWVKGAWPASPALVAFLSLPGCPLSISPLDKLDPMHV